MGGKLEVQSVFLDYFICSINVNYLTPVLMQASGIQLMEFSEFQ